MSSRRQGVQPARLDGREMDREKDMEITSKTKTLKGSDSDVHTIVLAMEGGLGSVGGNVGDHETCTRGAEKARKVSTQSGGGRVYSHANQTFEEWTRRKVCEIQVKR